jgi:uncharacterized protein (DUF302 family)
MTNELGYGYTVNLGALPFDQAEQKLVAALKEEGFGVLTEIDVQEKFKEKLSIDFRRYKILGACNPKLAHQALTAELPMGLMMPCTVTIYEEDSGEITVAIAKPQAIFAAVENENVAPMAAHLEEAVGRILEKVSGHTE